MANISRIINKIKHQLLVFLLDKLAPVYLMLVMVNFNLPHVQATEAVSLSVQLSNNTDKVEVIRHVDSNPSDLPLHLTAEEREPRYKIKLWVTAYNSLPGQTDSTPCITASGLNVCERSNQGAEDIIATNLMRLPFGTKVRIPELFGDKIFLVHDRMNARYTKRVDVWMAEYADAKKFGKQYTEIEIF
ncbi:MAG: hypothetical protein Q8P32_00370 [Candidatus Komeilibacteria bacterium]|nr:hypothetical protein [Candidatus Komeilibacteria bacterium]